MSWLIESLKAKTQLAKCNKNKCNGCHKCVWIEMSGQAMESRVKVKESEPHPLEKYIENKFQ